MCLHKVFCFQSNDLMIHFTNYPRDDAGLRNSSSVAKLTGEVHI